MAPRRSNAALSAAEEAERVEILELTSGPKRGSRAAAERQRRLATRDPRLIDALGHWNSKGRQILIRYLDSHLGNELAELCGVDRSTISLLASGKTQYPAAPLLFALEDIAGVPPRDWLLPPDSESDSDSDSD